MRTTVVIEPTLLRKIKTIAARERRPFKQVLDEILRRGLGEKESAAPLVPFVVEPHSGGFRPGIDQARFNQLSDELEAEDFAGEARGR